jgi:hypothetical protein
VDPGAAANLRFASQLFVAEAMNSAAFGSGRLAPATAPDADFNEAQRA